MSGLGTSQKSMGPAKWCYLHLRIIDSLSRRVVGWCVADGQATPGSLRCSMDATHKNPPKGSATLHGAWRSMRGGGQGNSIC